MPVRIPRTRWFLLPIFLVSIPSLLFLWCDKIPRSQIILLGLMMDVLGATILAIPDVPFLRKYTVAGNLRYCLDRLTDNWGTNPIAAPDSDISEVKVEEKHESFYYFRDLMKEKQHEMSPPTATVWEDVQYVKAEEWGKRR